MTAHADDRPSGPSLPGDRAGGPVFPTGDVRQGVEAWMAGSDGPPPQDRGSLGPDADADEVARKILLDQLTGQARSRSELGAKLAKKGVPDEVAERLLNRFEEVGLVDDAAFARAWVQSRQRGKGLARRALAQELRRKGIDDDVAKDALDEVDPEDETESARLLVRRKLRTVQSVDRTTAVRRLSGMLARKGYPPGIAFGVVREELEAAGHDSGGLDQGYDTT